MKAEKNVQNKKRYRSRTSCLGSICAFIGIGVSLLWLLNPQMGIFLEIPDNLPIVGNLDEAFFTLLLVASLSYFGVEIPFLSRRYDYSLKNKKGSDINDK